MAARWLLLLTTLSAGCAGRGAAVAEPEPRVPTESKPEPSAEADGDEEPAAAPEPRRSEALKTAIAALPVIARIDDLAPTPFVLRGALPAKRAAEMERVARAVIADVARRFVGREGDRPVSEVDVCLFDDEEAYVAFAEITRDSASRLGYYLPRERVIAANLARSVGNLRHELVHPLIGDHVREVPAWVNEGLGSLYGTARIEEDGVVFLVNYRLRHVRKAMRRGELPTLDDMALSTSDDLYGAEGMTYYGTARYVLLYLDAGGNLDAFYRALTAEKPSSRRQRELLGAYLDDESFARWTRRLRMGRVAPPPR